MFNIYKRVTEDMKKVPPPPAFKIQRIELDWALDYAPRDLTPCKMCGKYDDMVKPTETPTGVEVGNMHPWCASQLIHEAMKELIRRMS